MHRRDYEVIASVLERNHDKFKSNTAHAKFAAEVGLVLWHQHKFDPGRFMWAAMPKAWRGTRKANVWERTIRSLRALTARGGAIDRAVHASHDPRCAEPDRSAEAEAYEANHPDAPFVEIDEASRCPVCGSPIDYCQGHGETVPLNRG